jgi:hypothetical protein
MARPRRVLAVVSRGRIPRRRSAARSAGERTLRTGRDEVGEHDVEAVDGLGAGFDQVVAVVDDRE